MDNSQILREQLQFFKDKRAGCLFAAAAARDPLHYGWVHRVIVADSSTIDLKIAEAIKEPNTTTLSLIFPAIASTSDLLAFLDLLLECELLSLGQKEACLDMICFGFRARINQLMSYVTGFGNFDFLPATRRAPFVELTMRVKPRPPYDFVFKVAPPGVIHLADLDMRGMPRDRLWDLWHNSFVETEKALGSRPDLRSAARTTYSIPTELVNTR